MGKFKLLLTTVLGFALLLPGCSSEVTRSTNVNPSIPASPYTAGKSETPKESSASASASPTAFTTIPPSPPLGVKLSMEKPALLNQPADLICTVTSVKDRPNTSAQIKLPAGANLLTGSLEWRGDLKAKIPVTFSQQIIFKETGHWTIEATLDNGRPMAFVYLNIQTDHSEFGWAPSPLAVVIAGPSPQVSLVFNRLPLLNEPADLNCTIKSQADFPSLTVQFLLPLGASIISGDPQWQGDLKAGIPVTFSKQVIFKQPGRNTIGWHITQAGRSTGWAGPEVICLNIGEKDSSFCQTPVPIPPPK